MLLDTQEHVLETYVSSGPIFGFMTPVEMIVEADDNGLNVPVPRPRFGSSYVSTTRRKMRSTALSAFDARFRYQRTRFGAESNHCCTGSGGKRAHSGGRGSKEGGRSAGYTLREQHRLSGTALG